MLLGVAQAARKMRKKVRWLYRHLDEYQTVKETIEVVRVVFDDTTGKPVKRLPEPVIDTACHGE